MAAQSLMAACCTVPPERLPHSMHSYFLRGGDTAIPIVYDVERMRDGGSFSTRRVAARQHGRVIYYLTASFQKQEPGYEHQDVMPDVPPAQECPDLPELLGRMSTRAADEWRREWSALAVRYVGDTAPGGGMDSSEHPAQARLWFRAAGDIASADQALHRCVLTYASDLTLLGSSLTPHPVMLGSPNLQAASLDHSIWFHRPVRADQWLLYDQISPSASGARGFAAARIFRTDGALVASVAQEGLIRPVGARTPGPGGGPSEAGSPAPTGRTSGGRTDDSDN